MFPESQRMTEVECLRCGHITTRTAADGGRPAYEHIVRSTIHNLQEAGYLARVGRGRYCLTDSGKTRAVI
jgi:predicted transcriptional regulator of viral defense system